MNYKKHKAFTIAELMIIMSLLVIIIAAFAPVFTVRYNNASTENVWAFVANDDQYDAYYDHINKSMTAQAFIGLTPTDKSDIANYAPYSKVVIRPTNKRPRPQAQMQFRYGSENSGAGKLVGELFADSTNMLFGGLYDSIQPSAAKYNSAYGVGALSGLSTGQYNTALGYSALKKVSTGSYNTAIGSNAANQLTTGSYNTLIGTDTGNKLVSGSYNTVVGEKIPLSSAATGNTIVGYNAAPSTSGKFNYNTVYGPHSMLKANSGEGNTAIGAYSLQSSVSGSYNTAIGYNACSEITGSHKTCVGANSGLYKDKSSDSGRRNKSKGLYTDDEERVYLGSFPVQFYRYDNRYWSGASVIEVHNVNSKNGSAKPFSMGDSSVLINGNFIVRGQTYLTARASLYDNQPALMLYFTERAKNRTHARPMGGLDGSERTEKVRGNRGRMHAQQGGRFSCVCAVPIGSQNGIVSYDWTTQMSAKNTSDDWRYGGSYTDKSTGSSITLKGNDHNSMDIDLNYAHMYSDGSCCPDLRSDIRLKNLSSLYTAGLDEINKLKVYNYTYKNDKNKLPHVGVIAQDLKQIFPNSVTKDSRGYYQIRWDEMFYAAINAIKTLNTKVEVLASRISRDRARIAALKQDNAEMIKKLDSLEKELSVLEKKHK